MTPARSVPAHTITVASSQVVAPSMSRPSETEIGDQECEERRDERREDAQPLGMLRHHLLDERFEHQFGDGEDHHGEDERRAVQVDVVEQYGGDQKPDGIAGDREPDLDQSTNHVVTSLSWACRYIMAHVRVTQRGPRGARTLRQSAWSESRPGSGGAARRGYSVTRRATNVARKIWPMTASITVRRAANGSTGT